MIDRPVYMLMETTKCIKNKRLKVKMMKARDLLSERVVPDFPGDASVSREVRRVLVLHALVDLAGAAQDLRAAHIVYFTRDTLMNEKEECLGSLMLVM